MKILISSNAFWAGTGYGTQSKILVDILSQLGHEVHFHAWYGLQGGKIKNGRVTVWPIMEFNYGVDTPVLASHIQPDLVISNHDAWVLPSNYGDSIRANKAKWLLWFPVDSAPLPDPIAKLALQADYPVVYSQFAVNEIEAWNKNNKDGDTIDSYYLPMCVDTDIYKPLDRNALKEEQGVDPNTFVFGMVAANKGFPCRKSFFEVFSAFKLFHDQHPNSFLYCHCLRHGKDNPNLDKMAETIGLPEGSLKFPDQDFYRMGLFDDHYMVNLYNMFDCLLSPSMGEGFGLPIIEAQACGTPVITQDFSSMSELTFNGIAIKPLQKWYNPLGTFWATPSIDRIHMAMTRVYHEHRGEQGQNASDFGRSEVVKTFSKKAAFENWRSFIENIEREIEVEKVGDYA